ncbi:MAG: Intracellular distribution of mitochondria [Bogoriella megaspora]|nr:MAG: Intracellular distribution of mitochondria [Bogoriella megaspora]
MSSPNHDVSDEQSNPPSQRHEAPSTTSQDASLSRNDGKQSLPNGTENGDAAENDFYDLTVVIPGEFSKEIPIVVSTREQVQDIRQSIVDQPDCLQYSCFHLEHNGERVSDFVELSEVPKIKSGSKLYLVEDPYTEKEARIHFIRIRELIGAAGDRADILHGLDAGLSLYDRTFSQSGFDIAPSTTIGSSVVDGVGGTTKSYELKEPAKIDTIIPPPEKSLPRPVKSLQLSSWNPPTHQLRSRGQLLYLEVITQEGQQFYITSSVSGFYVNRSGRDKFDPSPKDTNGGKHQAHSLLTLLQQLSPRFTEELHNLQEQTSRRDLLATCQLSNAIPASPWVVPKVDLNASHRADIVRTQESYLLSGSEGTESLRDWNEEFQSTRELPKESIADRVFRERLTSKLFADYNEAATRGAILVAKGEVAPLNPTEGRYAQIFVYNNVFYSFGADGVGTFATDGGDEAARVATGKDVTGVKAVNQLDIDGLFTPGTVVVDYLGKRIVAQSIVPGIFKQRDPSEHQIDYGGVEGKDTVAENEQFIEPFKELSKHLRVKKHPVWDKEHVRHDLEGSVETKGLLGTDGRKYVLDLYRTTPLDIEWLENYWTAREDGQGPIDEAKNYPHRMTVLRPELVDAFWRLKLQQYLNEKLSSTASDSQVSKIATNGDVTGEKEPSTNGELTTNHVNGDQTTNDDDDKKTEAEDNKKQEEQEKRNQLITDFDFALNPDVFSGQEPQTDQEKQELVEDEKDVRAACQYLTTDALPRILKDLKEGDVGFPMDGQSLVSLMHKRGINVRYLGKLAQLLSSDAAASRTHALRTLVVREMIARSFKHVVNRRLRDVATPAAPACLAHLLNCLLGASLNECPAAEKEEYLKSWYKDADWSFEQITPDSLRKDLIAQAQMRYRFDLKDDLPIITGHLQLLREVALKLGLQLTAKDYQFTKDQTSTQSNSPTGSDTNEKPQVNGTSTGASKKKKKGGHGHSPNRQDSSSSLRADHTFSADDVQNVIPIIKEASPRSVLADEAMEAGRISLAQDQRTLGNELLLESMSLHEQIYGILHPEVARAYYTLSTLFYSTNRELAADLAKKAVIVAERTIGVDSADTILSYLNLSLFSHNNNDTASALKYVSHALDLWKLVYGSLDHPDSITTINNAAVMLQTKKDYKNSRQWFEESLEICKRMSGPDSINTATLLFQLAQALALDHDSKGAVDKMREARDIFKKQLGPEDRNTKEAEQWFERLVTNAVSISKHLKELQDHRSKRLGGRVAHIVQQPQAGARAAEVLTLPGQGATTGMGRSRDLEDKRDIEKLLKYINGEEVGGTKTPKARNPNKRRGGQKA